MPQHLLLRIYGRVQGVWFRETARRQAEARGVTGFARNDPDGTVLIEAEGEEAPLNQFVDWCHQGPTLARVDQVDIERGEVKGYKAFEVRR